MPDESWRGMLLGPSLETVTGGISTGPVDVPHTSEADYFVDGLGRRWVRKSLAQIGWQELLAEIVGWFLGRQLGVPVPDAAVLSPGSEDAAWLSAYIPHTVHWEAHHAHFVTDLNGFGAMLALDAIIHNHDRHKMNILLAPGAEEPDLDAWAIDTGAALVGFPADFAAAELEVPEKPKIARGLPVRLMEQGAYKAAKRAAELASSPVLQHQVAEACRLVGERESNILFSALSKRMKQATRLVERYIEVVGAIS